jgi:hypothetical protein
MKVYRVENEAEQKGLWRKFDGYVSNRLIVKGKV